MENLNKKLILFIFTTVFTGKLWLNWKTKDACSHAHTYVHKTKKKKKKTQTPTFGFHPKYFSTRLVRFSENHWHLQASCRDGEDELKSQFSVNTVFWNRVFHQPQLLGVFDRRRMAQPSAHTQLPWGRGGMLVVLYLASHTKNSRGQQHSRNTGFSSLLHKGAPPGFSSFVIN